MPLFTNAPKTSTGPTEPVQKVQTEVMETVTDELPEPASPASIYQKGTDKNAKVISLNNEEVNLTLARLMELAEVSEGAQYQQYKDAEKIAGKIRMESTVVDSLIYFLNQAKREEGRAVFIVEGNENNVTYHYPSILRKIFEEEASGDSEIIPRDTTISAERLFKKILAKLPDQKITDIPSAFAAILRHQFDGRYLISNWGAVFDLQSLKCHTFDLNNKANAPTNLLSHNEMNWLFGHIGNEVLDGPIDKKSSQNIWRYICKNNQESLSGIGLSETDLALQPLFTHDTSLIMDQLEKSNSPELIKSLIPKIIEYYRKIKTPKSEEEIKRIILGLWIGLFRARGDKFSTPATPEQIRSIESLVGQMDRVIISKVKSA